MKNHQTLLPFVTQLLVLVLAAGSAHGFQSAEATQPADKASADEREAPSAAVATSTRESDAEKEPSTPRLWVGVSCEEIGPVLQAQLGIEAGLAIRDIAEGSPAEKADLRIFDLILRFNDRPIGSIKDFNRSVQETHGERSIVEIMRSGEKRTLNVQPEPRPPCKEIESIIVAVDANDEVDPKVLELVKETMDAKPSSKQKELLVLRPFVELGVEGTPAGGSSNDRNTPNGSPLHLELKNMVRDALLFDLALLDEDQPISGCCLKLLQVVHEQIKLHENGILQCQTELAALESEVSAGQAATGEEPSERQVKLEAQLQVHQLKRQMLIEIRDRLKADIERQREPSKPDANPGHSRQADPDQCVWS